jgi:hypothetical protein
MHLAGILTSLVGLVILLTVWGISFWWLSQHDWSPAQRREESAVRGRSSMTGLIGHVGAYLNVRTDHVPLPDVEDGSFDRALLTI